MAQMCWRLLFLLFFSCQVVIAQPPTDSPSVTLSPTISLAPSVPAPTQPGKDTAGQVMGALIFIALIVLVIGFGIYGWRKNKFSELTRIDLEQGQTLDEELPAEKLKPDDVALAAAVGPTYFEKQEERKREEPFEKPAIIHLPEGGSESQASSSTTDRRGSTSQDPFGQIESALSQPRSSASEEADRQVKQAHDLALYEEHRKQQEQQTERRSSLGENQPAQERRASIDQMVMNEVEAKRRADAAAVAARQAEEAMERAEEDMRQRQKEELQEAERRDAEAAEARQAILLMEQARDAEIRQAELAREEAGHRAEQEKRALEALANKEQEEEETRTLEQQAADLRPTPIKAFGNDPFGELDTEVEPKSPPLDLPSTADFSEPLSPGEEDAEAALAQAQAALEAAEAEQRAMEAALEAERLAGEEEEVTDLS